ATDGGVDVTGQRRRIGDALVEGDKTPVDLAAAGVAEGEHVLPALRERTPCTAERDDRADQVLIGSELRVEQLIERRLAFERRQQQPEEARRVTLTGRQLGHEPLGRRVELVPDVDRPTEE